jgi:hypothetical protein
MTLGRSPLLHPVTVDWPIVGEPPAAAEALLHLWLADHCGRDYQDTVHRAVISQTEAMVWSLGPADLRAGTAVAHRPILGPLGIALRYHPPREMLRGLADAGVLGCAALVANEDGTERWRCNVRVDSAGRHLGDHIDGRFGDEACWPNGNPSDSAPHAGPAAAGPTRSALRGVIAAALWLCHHDLSHPLSYTPPDDCAICRAIDRAAAAVHAMIGEPTA